MTTYVQQSLEDLERSTNVVRGMVAIQQGLLWPVAIANFMAKDEYGRWNRVFSIEV